MLEVSEVTQTFIVLVHRRSNHSVLLNFLVSGIAVRVLLKLRDLCSHFVFIIPVYRF